MTVSSAFMSSSRARTRWRVSSALGRIRETGSGTRWGAPRESRWGQGFASFPDRRPAIRSGSAKIVTPGWWFQPPCGLPATPSRTGGFPPVQVDPGWRLQVGEAGRILLGNRGSGRTPAPRSSRWHKGLDRRGRPRRWHQRRDALPVLPAGEAAKVVGTHDPDEPRPQRRWRNNRVS